MDVTIIAETLNIVTNRGLGLANSLLHRNNFVSNNNLLISDYYATVICPVDAVAPPPVKPNSRRTASRLRRKRRTRRKLFGGDDSENGVDGGIFGDSDRDGPFGNDGSGSDGGGGSNWGGGGDRWNPGGYGGSNWDDSSSPSSSFALNFVYEVISWIALSNCVHFAFKKLLRMVADWIGDTERNKDPLRLTSMC